MLAMGVLTYVALSDQGILGASGWADVLGFVAAISAGLLFFGWVLDNSKLNMSGLMIAFFIWGFRFWAVLLVNGPSVFNRELPYLTLAWMIVTGGAWLLERSVSRED